jgi:hypothetical protein
MMHRPNHTFNLLKTMASGAKRRRDDHCMRRYTIIAKVPSVQSAFKRLLRDASP